MHWFSTKKKVATLLVNGMKVHTEYWHVFTCEHDGDVILDCQYYTKIHLLFVIKFTLNNIT